MSSNPTIYNIIVFGEPSVGKTCFIDQAYYGRSFVSYEPDHMLPSHTMTVDGQASRLFLMDLSTSFLKPEQRMHDNNWAKSMLADSEGIVLLYDVTSLESFRYITDQAYKFLWDCRKLKFEDGEEADEEEREKFGCVLVGNKADLVYTNKETREVSQSLAEEWAQTQGIKNIEVDSLERNGPDNALELLVRNIRKIKRLTGLQASGVEKQEEETKEQAEKSSIRNTLKEIFKSPKT